MLLGVETDHEGWDVDDLLADTRFRRLAPPNAVRAQEYLIPDVSLLDEDTGVVDGLGKTESVDAGLETALQEILDLEGQDVIESEAGLVKDTDAYKTADQSVTLEKTLGVLLVEREELTNGQVSKKAMYCVAWKYNIPTGTTDLGEGELDTPDLTLVAQAILAKQFQLGITIGRKRVLNSWFFLDLSRGKLLLIGRGILTDGRTRML